MAKIKIYRVKVSEYDSVSKTETQAVMVKTLYAETVPLAYTRFTSKITLPANQFVASIEQIAYIDEEFNPGA